MRAVRFGPRKLHSSNPKMVPSTFESLTKILRPMYRLCELPPADFRLFFQPDCPEVARKIVAFQVGIRNGEIAAHAPARAPGISRQKSLRGLVIADREHGMATEYGFACIRHRNGAGMRNAVALEADINCKNKTERITRDKTSLHILDRLWHVRVTDDAMPAGGRITGGRRLLCKLILLIRPQHFRTGAKARDSLHAITQHRAVISFGGLFDDALIVINK